MKTPSYGNVMGFNPTGDLGPFTVYTAKNRKPVFYIKAPPTRPATARQRFNRLRIEDTARWWRQQTPEVRTLWELASKRANLRMCGYALFQWWNWHHDEKKLQTIMRQSGIQLTTI